LALIGSLNKPLMSSRGPLGQLFEIGVQGLGGGAVVNVFDKEILQGKLTGIGVTLPFNLGANPVRLNATDAAFWLLVNGLNLTKGGLIKSALKLGLKKVAESRAWIDPPAPGFNYSSSNPSMGQGAQDVITMPSISGGLTHS